MNFSRLKPISGVLLIIKPDLKVTTNIRTLELTHFYRTVSTFWGQYLGDSITLFRTAISIDKTKASVSKLSFDTDANYFVLFSKQNLPQVISALEKTKV